MTTGAEGDRALSTEEYDFVILDIELPLLDGFEVLRRLRKRKAAVPVLVLTARDSVHDRIHGLDIGADDYLTKPFEMGELEARMRALVRRAQGIAENEISLGRLVLDLKGRRALVDGAGVELSAREWAVLELLAARAGRVVSKDALMKSLYEWDEEVSPNAIEIYVHRVRKKLMDSGVTIRTIRGLGYLLERPQHAD
ncbi:MAG: response regulator [Betaproteobacteria bacterium]|nr:response regulator [Betaproteobacteria bacterium]MEA3157476.1 two-component system, OmpR family, response regulator TctD [Betaproteobacteria bacterium]